MFNLIRTEIYRSIKSPMLYTSALMIFCICWMQNIEMENMSLETSISVLLGISGVNCSNPADMSSIALISAFSGSWYFNIILTAACALSFAVYFCDERTSGMIRFTVSRSGKVYFFAGKLICAVIVSVMAVLIGFAAFSLTACCFVRPITDFCTDEIINCIYSHTGTLINALSGNIKSYFVDTIVNQLVCVSINAAFWTAAAMIICVIKPNKYFTLIAPVVCYYLWEKIVSGIQSLSFSNVILAPYINFFSFRELCGEHGINTCYTVILLILFILIRLAVPTCIYLIVSLKRVDIGETS